MTDLNEPIYTAAMASRLVGLQPGRVRRWLRGYQYNYDGPGDLTIRVNKGPVIRRSTFREEGFASFVDLVDLLFVRRFLDEGLSLQRIRKILREAEDVLQGQHFAHRTFFSVGREVFLRVGDEGEPLLHLLTGGQYAFEKIIAQLGHQIDFDEVSGFAVRWFPFGRHGHVVVDPNVAFGSPSVVGHSITTANVYDMFRGERERTNAVASWLGLEEVKVEAAVEFERQLEAA